MEAAGEDDRAGNAAGVTQRRARECSEEGGHVELLEGETAGARSR
jgi:hypothetical protein